ncbi:MAG: DUF1874 domain-containing protein [Desulfurococcaceae archaeon]|nr:DUF1874 domain-containing protein [Desulfurococcaceae archaeon]
MGKIYLLNAPIVPIDVNRKCVAVVTRVDNIEYIKKFIEFWRASGMEVVSAIGHESTARLLTKMLGFEVKTQRVPVTAGEGDVIVAFTLNFRLPEGKVLSDAELENIVASRQYSFTIVDVLKCYVSKEELSILIKPVEVPEQ